MTLKEAVLKSLEELNKPSIYADIYKHIEQNKYFDFGNSKTPFLSVSGVLTDFIQKNDTRIKRIKQQGGTYSFYLTKNEQNIAIDVLSDEAENQTTTLKNPTKTKTYEERDLHKLLSSYLKNTDTYSKIIFHEQSNGKDNNQIWTHPDMVGIKFLNLQTKASQNFLKTINRNMSGLQSLSCLA
jgi:hypothetical protein